MTTTRKIGTIRQLSLQCETPTIQQRRKSLKKQLSEDNSDIKDWLKLEPQPRAASAKNRSKVSERPSSVKIAWTDNIKKTLEEQLIKKDESLVAKKCREIRRPTTAKVGRQSSLDKDDIMYSRQELAQKLRQAWNDREKGKRNLDIFLAPNPREKHNDELNCEVADFDSQINNETQDESPNVHNTKLIIPLQAETLVNENNYKNIFQKQLRKSKSICSDFEYSPTKTNEKSSRSSTIVVVPVINEEKGKTQIENSNRMQPIKADPNIFENRRQEAEGEDRSKQEFSSTNAKPINDVIIRVSTAQSRRESFQKRVNSAFHETVKKEIPFRPPLIRSTSVPTKPEAKPKFLTTKRRAKTAKRKEKSEKIIEDTASDSDGKDSSKHKKVLRRCITLTNGEIETMVSLISPTGSDAEETDENEKEKVKSTVSSPVKEIKKTEEIRKEDPKNFSLRKTVKSVSFQQSSIHAVRSFSASFPARRGSIATALLLNNSTSKTANAKLQEKRAPSLYAPDDDERVPKRRLVRTKSAPLKLSIDEDNDDENTEDTVSTEKNSEDGISISVLPKPLVEIQTNIERKVDFNVNKDFNEKESTDKVDENCEPIFENPKEKQCWDLYCKMSGKGVNVSFDTILRGMLTPSEYRMRKKPSIESDTNPDSNS